MEGIFGLVNLKNDKPIDEEAINQMASILHHGKDKKGPSIYRDRSFAFGINRYCHTPSYQRSEVAHNAKKSIYAVLHGEIYNYPALKKELAEKCALKDESDVELMVHLYDAHGPEMGKKINGLFTLAIWDAESRKLLIMNDRFGQAHSLYWTEVGGQFIFASHLRSLLTLPQLKREIDYPALNLFFKYSYIPSPHTILKGVNKLPPAHLVTASQDGTSQKSYWDFAVPDEKIKDEEFAVKKYLELFEGSIVARLDADRDVGVFLSGGLDTSANVALAAQCSPKKIKTFVIGFNDPAFDERPHARIVADHFKTDHYEYVITGDEINDLPGLIWNLEEPYFELGLYLTYLGLKAAKDQVDVVIGGEGADQLFGTGGFVKTLPVTLRYVLDRAWLLKTTRYLTETMKGDIFYNRDNVFFKGRLLLNRATDFNDWYFYGYDAHELDNLYLDKRLSTLPEIFDNSPILSDNTYETLYNHSIINQDLLHYANENVMVKSGRMANMLGMTLRESFLDRDLVDFLLSLDLQLKRKGTLTDFLRGKSKAKYLHRVAMKDLLPGAIMNKPKQGGFVPLRVFMGDPSLRQRIYRHLSNSQLIRSHFRLDYVKSLFDIYEQAENSPMYWYNYYSSKVNRIMFLLVFDLWHQLFIENTSLAAPSPHLNDYF